MTHECEHNHNDDHECCGGHGDHCGHHGHDKSATPPTPGIAKYTPNSVSSFKHVIGIVSGKGGVGKTLVTCLLASELHRQGKKVGILDADVTGPSIPTAFGTTGPLVQDDTGIIPAESADGIKLMSTNFMLPEPDMAVAWRGPVINGVLAQFFKDVNWGDLDYLLIDMPPGTGDVALTVFQSLPLEGIITVSAPQDLVSIIVGKAVNLAKDINLPVLGLVENMAYFKCPNCNEKHAIFGESQGKEVAQKYDIPAYCALPIDPAIAKLVDAGKIMEYNVEGALDEMLKAIGAL
ncbi:MAG: Mrp/NBP35 family ATP-binding protein [Eggerthellaceae bacterium]|nr:Mrp/NBP35 family ATP-binding protein [Eggerthellaceae bacterium]